MVIEVSCSLRNKGAYFKCMDLFHKNKRHFSSCGSIGAAKNIFYIANNFDVSNENAICHLINYIYNVIVIKLIIHGKSVDNCNLILTERFCNVIVI